LSFMWGRYALAPLNVSSWDAEKGSKRRVSDVKCRLPSGVHTRPIKRWNC
jgi:hypothetical protein